MSQDEDTLKSGQLGTADVTASTVANIGPGIDFYFAFGVIAVTAGVAAPLTILAAGVAVVLLAFTVAEFTKTIDAIGTRSRSSDMWRSRPWGPLPFWSRSSNYANPASPPRTACFRSSHSPLWRWPSSSPIS